MPRVGALLPGGCKSSDVAAGGQGRGSIISRLSHPLQRLFPSTDDRPGSDRLSTEGLGPRPSQNSPDPCAQRETEAPRSGRPG